MQQNLETSGTSPTHHKTSSNEKSTSSAHDLGRKDDRRNSSQSVAGKEDCSNHSIALHASKNEEWKQRSGECGKEDDYYPEDESRAVKDKLGETDEKCHSADIVVKRKSCARYSIEIADRLEVHTEDIVDTARPERQILGTTTMSDGEITLNDHFVECSKSSRQRIGDIKLGSEEDLSSNTPVVYRKPLHYRRRSASSPIQGQLVPSTFPQETSCLRALGCMTRSTPYISNRNSTSTQTSQSNSGELVSEKSIHSQYLCSDLPEGVVTSANFGPLLELSSKEADAMPMELRARMPTFPNDVDVFNPQPTRRSLSAMPTAISTMAPPIHREHQTKSKKPSVQFKLPVYDGPTLCLQQAEEIDGLDPHTVPERSTKRKEQSTEDYIPTKDGDVNHCSGFRKRARKVHPVENAANTKSGHQPSTCENCYHGHLKCEYLNGLESKCSQCESKNKQCSVRVKKRGNKNGTSKPKKLRKVVLKQDGEMTTTKKKANASGERLRAEAADHDDDEDDIVEDKQIPDGNLSSTSSSSTQTVDELSSNGQSNKTTVDCSSPASSSPEAQSNPASRPFAALHVHDEQTNNQGDVSLHKEDGTSSDQTSPLATLAELQVKYPEENIKVLRAAQALMQILSTCDKMLKDFGVEAQPSL